jgi:uncharacterized protein (DUF1501 family)
MTAERAMKKLSRRTLLQSAAAAGVGMMLPQAGFAAGAGTRAVGNWNRVLVLIELDGGNDGLNTVIPYAVSPYQTRRPTLKYTLGAGSATYLGTGTYRTGGADQAQPFALNPGMPRLMPAWGAGDLAVLLGVGYPSPNLSHFRSMDIWNSGSDADELLYDGWLGRLYVGETPPASFTAHGVLLARYSSNPLTKPGIRYLAMSKPEDFLRRSYSLRDTDPTPVSDPQLKHLLTVQHDVVTASGKFRTALMTPKPGITPGSADDYLYTPPAFSSAVAFNPDSDFEQQCKYVAEMIATNSDANPAKRLQIPVYKVHLGGFDNHSSQKAKHEDLLAQVASGMANLRKAMVEKGLWDNVLVMTYSEFGRRPEENGSAGTDHGTANCHFMLGGKVKGGLFYGKQPGLANGDFGPGKNLVANLDYRSMYRTAALWLGLTPDAHLTPYPAVDCVELV